MKLLDDIRSLGYWKVVIRPAIFESKKVPDLRHLLELVRRSSIQFRGWDFPHMGSRTGPSVGIDWIGQECEWDYVRELWRVYQSGQFVFFGGLREDRRDQSGLWPADASWRPKTVLHLEDAVLCISEFIEFSARYAVTEAGSDQMVIELQLNGLNGRQLWTQHPFNFPLLPDERTSSETFTANLQVNRTELVASPKEIASRVSTDLMRHFGWEASPEFLLSIRERTRL